MKVMAIVLIGILVCIQACFASVSGSSDSIRSTPSSRECDDLSETFAALSLTNGHARASVWTIQQVIEDAHESNNFTRIEQIHNYCASMVLEDEQWHRVSQEIIETSTPSSPHWHNWYSRWVKWETQSSWREAVMSALFFPQRYFLESRYPYAYWENNEAVSYSVKLSAFYNNPQSKLYFAEKQSTEAEDDTSELPSFSQRVLDEEVAKSTTEMGRELFATYGEMTKLEAKKVLQDLAERSVTALFLLADMSEEEEKMRLFTGVGEKGYARGYLEVASLIDETREKVSCLQRAGRDGYALAWRLTKEVSDYEKALQYYLGLGGKGNSYGFYKAAMLMLDLEPTERKPELITEYLLKACAGGVLLANSELQTFVTGSRRTMLSKDYHSSLVKKFRLAKTKAESRKARITELFEKIWIF